MKICSVVGARPQFVKSAAVSRAIRADGRISEVLIQTGQHYDFAMSEVFFREFELAPPRYSLGVGSASHGAQTARMIENTPEQAHTHTPEDSSTDKRFLQALARALDTLPLDQRIAFVLCDVEERTAAEAAELTDAPAATIRTRLHHARKKLREALEKEGFR